MRIRRLNHSVYQVQYHVVWGTKYRYKILKPYVKRALIRKIFELIKMKYPSWYVYKINTGDDHVHMLIEIPPKYAVSEIVGYIKGKSAIAVARNFSGKKRNFNPSGFNCIFYGECAVSNNCF